MNKTPKFDRALDKVLEDLKPQKRICRTCQAEFVIFQEDIEMYHKLRVPPPRECPVCRMRKRMSMMANLLRFYKKECAAHPGERVVSQMDEENYYKIYDNKYWWDINAWDAVSFGRSYDSSRPFVSQLISLLRDVPHMALARYNKNLINSDYTVDSFDVKNCYLAATLAFCENVSYGVWVLSSRDSLDLLRVNHVEHCYEASDCTRCFNSQYIQNCTNCSDSSFLFECHNCQYCFGCINLRSKKYCFFNEQLSEEEYRKKITAVDLGSRQAREIYTKRFNDFLSSRGIFRAVHTRNSPGSLGDHLFDCKNCFWAFSAISFKWVLTFYKNENVRYGQDIMGVKDTTDVTIFGPGELCYNVIEGFSVNKTIASYFIGDSLEMEYSFECFDCKYCFGCSGLHKKQYCILNKQYTPEEYWRVVDEIKTKMLLEGSYGEFLPLEHSFFYYNDTYAQAMLPYDRMSAEKHGARWRETEPKMESTGLQSIAAGNLPDHIRDTDDDILEKAIICEETGRPFQIIKLELEFYRKHNIPLPTKHPQARLLERFRRKNPYQLWERTCVKCGEITHTSYAPDRPEKNIYCERCYLKEIG